MAGIVLAAELAGRDLGDRQARQDGGAVIAGLAALGDMRIAAGGKEHRREQTFGAFGLLQTQNVGLPALEEAADQVGPQPHRLIFQVAILSCMSVWIEEERGHEKGARSGGRAPSRPLRLRRRRSGAVPTAMAIRAGADGHSNGRRY